MERLTTIIQDKRISVALESKTAIINHMDLSSNEKLLTKEYDKVTISCRYMIVED